jgi:hypothetical protein
MALVNTLQIKLEAITTGLQKGLDAASQSVDDFLKSSGKLGDVIKKANDQIKQTKTAADGAAAPVSRLGGLFAKFQGGLDNAGRSVADFAARNKTLGAVFNNLKNAILSTNPLLAAGVGILTGLAFAVRGVINRTVELADALTIQSGRTGETVETLSQLKFVAEQNNVEFGALAGSLRILNRNIGLAAGGNEQAAASFKKLKVDVRDANGDIKQGSVVLEEVFRELAKFPDTATRAAKGQLVLGRTIHQVMPLVGVDIKAAREEADRFGATITTKFAMQADDYGDNLGKLRTIQQGLGVQLAQVLVPELNNLVIALLPIAQDAIPEVAKGLGNLGFWLSQTIDKISFANKSWEAWFISMSGLPRAVKQARIAELNGELETLNQRLSQTREEFEAEVAAALKSVPATKAAGAAHEEAAAGVSTLASELEKLSRISAFEDPLARTAEAAERRAREAAERQKQAEAAVEFARGVKSKRPEEPLPEPDLTPLPVPEIEDGTEAIETFGQELLNVKAGFEEVVRIGAQAFGAIQGFAGGLGDALVASATGAKTAFSDFFKGMLRQIAVAIARALILRAILSFSGIGNIVAKVQGFLNPTAGAAPLETPSFDAFAKSEGTRFGMLFATGLRGSLASTALQGIAAAGPGTAQVTVEPRIVVSNAGPMARVEWFERGQEQRLRRRQTELGGEAL